MLDKTSGGSARTGNITYPASREINSIKHFRASNELQTLSIFSLVNILLRTAISSTWRVRSMKLVGFRPILLVARFDECFRFYRDIMGFKVAWGTEGESYATFVVDGINKLSIFKRDDMAKVIGSDNVPSESVSQDRFAITFGVDDISSALNDLRKNGAKFITPIIEQQDWGIRTIFLRDPDGTLLQIESDLPRHEWSEELKRESKKYKNEN